MILIGCPGPSARRLEGVEHDIENIYRYHQTPRAGGWLREEVVVLVNPDRRQVLDAVGSVQADFLRVYFSGHGGIRTEIDVKGGLADVTYLELWKGEWVRDQELINPWVRRQENIMDCCRRRPRGASIGGIPETLTDIPFTAGEFWHARRLMDNYIRLSPNGIRFIYAAGCDQWADDTRSGGAFTVALLNHALKNWTDVRQDNLEPRIPGQVPSAIDNPIGMDTLIKQVSADLSLAGRSQQPEIVNIAGDLHVPFALNSPWPTHHNDGGDLIQAQRPLWVEPPRRADSAKAILTIGAALLGAWLVNEALIR